MTLEYVVRSPSGCLLRAFDPLLTPAQLQAQCLEDDLVWKNGRFRVITPERMANWRDGPVDWMTCE